MSQFAWSAFLRCLNGGSGKSSFGSSNPLSPATQSVCGLAGAAPHFWQVLPAQPRWIRPQGKQQSNGARNHRENETARQKPSKSPKICRLCLKWGFLRNFARHRVAQQLRSNKPVQAVAQVLIVIMAQAAFA